MDPVEASPRDPSPTGGAVAPTGLPNGRLERRQAPRLPIVASPTVARRVANGDTVPVGRSASIVDISASGLLVYVHDDAYTQPVVVGDRLDLGGVISPREAARAAPAPEPPVRVDVVRVQRLQRGSHALWAVGCRFRRPGRGAEREEHEEHEERLRLEGVLLAARTAEHLLNNQLSLTVGYAELLARDPRLPDDARALAREALRGAQAAASTVHRLPQVRRLAVETGSQWPQGGVIDLEHATGPEHPPRA